MIIADMKANKKHIVTEMFMRVRIPNTSLAFISQSYFKMSKDMRKIQHIILSWKYLKKRNLTNNAKQLVPYWVKRFLEALQILY